MLDLGQIIEAVEGNAIPYSVLQERNGKKICRVEVHDNKTVILKLWRRVSLKGRIRALFNAQDMHREARALRLLAKACVNVPSIM
jgi:aminoglycoside phosphotransferase (APT) family kinase protein